MAGPAPIILGALMLSAGVGLIKKGLTAGNEPNQANGESGKNHANEEKGNDADAEQQTVSDAGGRVPGDDLRDEQGGGLSDAEQKHANRGRDRGDGGGPGDQLQPYPSGDHGRESDLGGEDA